MLVAVAAAACGLAVFVAARPEPTLADQARELHEVEPYGLEGLTLSSWTRSGTELTATYTGEGASARFDLRLWASDGAAAEWWRERTEDLTGVAMDAGAGEAREACGSGSERYVCVGYDGHRTFEAAVTGYRPGDVDPRLMLRIARKHRYHVMGGGST